MEELQDLIRTKEEEIQILWNVIKEINKHKGGAFNMSQLQKLVVRSEAGVNQNLLMNSRSENMLGLYTTPNP